VPGVSTENDRPRHGGGGYDSGMFTPGTPERYSTSGFSAAAPAPPRTEQAGYYDEGGFGSGEETTIFSSDSSPAFDALTDEEAPTRAPAAWHAGLDLGLLVLRLVLGALFIGRGLQVLFGWFQGDGIDGTIKLLEGFGFHEHTTVLAWVIGVTELSGGTLVLLGLFTPAGAAAILGLVASAIWVRFNANDFAGRVELESIYAASAFALLFIGPGRVSLDRPTPWYRYASAFGVIFLILAGAATVTMVTTFR
jgi:putative oxidoreductase